MGVCTAGRGRLKDRYCERFATNSLFPGSMPDVPAPTDIGDDPVLSLFMANRRQLVNYAGALLGDFAQAEDLVQDSYLRFAAAMSESLPDEPLGYLYRIVRNLALDRHRQRRREARLMSPENEATRDIPADAPSPESTTLHRAEIRLLQAALAELPERTRRALEMHRLGGARLREIAAALGVSSSTAHTLVMEGLAHCQRRLKRGGS